MEHSFVIPVYRSAPNLAALVQSLRSQRRGKSDIVITTSTPSPALEAFASASRLRLHINPQRVDICTDWNFALEAAGTPLVTLAHQDDLFAPDYLERMVEALERNAGSVLAFCDYSEHTEAGPRQTNINLRIKRALCRHAFGKRECITERSAKLRLLKFGNPICCPSVLLNRGLARDFRFPAGFRTNLDWMAWLELARRPGGFVYVRERLVSKGVHQGSETTATIADHARDREDRLIFRSLWPTPMATMLATLYRLGYLANRVTAQTCPSPTQTTPNVANAIPTHCNSDRLSP